MTTNLSNALQTLGIDPKWEEPLRAAFDKYEINTPKRQAAFIGQCAHESANFTKLEENLNYSPERLTKVWPSRFPDLASADKYAYNPQALANKVYAGRLGNNQENDGWNFHGRGLIQLTGRENYERCGSSLGVDLISNPAWLLDPKYAALSAGWFWNKKGLNELADQQEHGQITKRINGGTLGLDDRLQKITKALAALG
jgi:putative chitinase